MQELPGGQGARRGFRLSGLLGRILATAVTVAILTVAVMFSMVFLAVALVVGLLVFGWLWWKFRAVLKQARQDPRFRDFRSSGAAQAQPRDDKIIDGEIISAEWQDDQDRR
jgi:hypothetical protein